MESVITVVLVVVNLLGFFMMGIDKRRAVKRSWRISEKWLWTVACFFGAIGATVGMYVFNHKTRHVSFRFGFPFLAMLQLLLVLNYL
ncbi:DUF1294 domain-containing protein [Pallidibacillus pasinlerensis]|nr:DUF1294 domain-containing protein [Pallidibacillus pasinlerensis]